MSLIDGRPGTTIPIQDRGFNYGDGLFETIAVLGGTPLLLEAHLDRLARGCRALGITPPDSATLRAECAQVLAQQPTAILKITLTRGGGGRGYQPAPDAVPTRIVALHPWPDLAPARRSIGITARCCNMTLARQPALAGIKHLNRLEQVLARAELVGSACDEGIMLDTEGNVVEGTMSNIFLVREGALLTPRLDQCGVAGVVRAELLARCAGLGLQAQQGLVHREDVLGADEVFFTNSIIGLWPARRIESREFPQSAIALRAARLLESAGCIPPP